MKRKNDGTFQKKFNIQREWLEEQYIKHKKSQSGIAKELGCSQSLIGKYLDQYDIEKRKCKCFVSHEAITLTEMQKEVLVGALLGDGCLIKPKNGNAQFSYCSSNKEHVEYVLSFFREYVTKESENGCKSYSFFDERTGKIYNRYYFRTQNNVTFTKVFNEWYGKGIKIIPNSTELTPLTTLLWYIGDGGLVNYGEIIRLNTNCFSKENIEEVLFPQLSRFEPYITVKENEQYVVSIPRINIKHFLKYIGPCPISSMSYKWKYKKYKNSKYASGKVTSHKENAESYVEMFLNGYGCYEIAKHYGVDFSAVRYYLKKAGVYDNACG